MTSLLRIIGVGLVASLLAGLAGWGVERLRFGDSDQAALLRVERELADRFDATAGTLSGIAARVTGATDLLRTAGRDAAASRALFERVEAALHDQDLGRTGMTVYGDNGVALAWGGRVFDLPKERLEGPSALFVASSAIGPRLVWVEPVSPRFGTIVVEQTMGGAEGAPGVSDTFEVSTSIVPVRVRPHIDGTSPPGREFTFVIPSRNGGLLVEAELSPADLAAARAHWRGVVWAAVISLFGVTLLFSAGPVLELRRRTRRTR